MAFRRRAPKPTTSPELIPLSLSDSQWRGTQLEGARRLVERYCGDAAMPPTLASLDVAIDGWFNDDDERIEVNALVNAVGVALGHHLAAALGLAWVIAADEDGSDLVLHQAGSDVLVSPCKLVAQRIVAGDRTFVAATFDGLVAELGNSD